MKDEEEEVTDLPVIGSMINAEGHLESEDVKRNGSEKDFLIEAEDFF